jgi:exonuclease III
MSDTSNDKKKQTLWNDEFSSAFEFEPDTKRFKLSSSSSTQKNLKTSPTVIVTWNCNGFVSRAKHNRDLLSKLLYNTNFPDMICIQEARIKAAMTTRRGQPHPEELKIDNQAVSTTLDNDFKDYIPYWSLADKRYAGTLTLIHKRLSSVQHIANSTTSAIDLLLQKFQLTRKQVGLLDTVEQRKSQKKKQTSIDSFLIPKKEKPITSFKNIHHEEGRFQFFSFPTVDILQTYVPNNGTKKDGSSFEKRKIWDDQVLKFLKERKQILVKSNNRQHRPLLWCGDMNVAHTYIDGTHWSGPRDDGSIYEWWTDESKCIMNRDYRESQRHPDNKGMPSFTPAERRRFEGLLKEGDFIDLWRHSHPSTSNNWDDANWTWRGFGGPYKGKGQRLDYFLLSSSLDNVDDVLESCDILGHGSEKEGLFCGSDHCACLLKLKRELG